MSKKTKRLVILLGVLAVLAAAYAALTLFNQKKAEQESKEAERTEKGILVQQMDKDQIQGFSYQHPHDEEYSDTTYIFSKKGDTWYYKDDLDFPVNETVLDTKLEDLSKVYAKRLLEESTENFKTYGLDDPALIISVTDGKNTVTYNIGNYNESTADYYMNVEGTDQVYTVDATLWVGFSMELYDMVEMDRFPEIQSDHITHMNIATKDQELDFTFEITGTHTDQQTQKVTNQGVWYIRDSSGAVVKANQSRTEALVSSIVGLSYVQEVDYDCPEEEYGKYGLDQPGAVITIDYTVDQVDPGSVEKVEIGENLNEIQYETDRVEKQMVISVGNPTEDFTFSDDYYIRTSDSSSIVTIDTALAETFLTLQRDTFVAPTADALNTEAPAAQ